MNGKLLKIDETPRFPAPIAVNSGVLGFNLPILDGPSFQTSLMRRFGKLRCFGVQSLHVCYVAANRLTAAISVNVKAWDDAAAALIVTEAGGAYSQFPGKGRPEWQRKILMRALTV